MHQYFGVGFALNGVSVTNQIFLERPEVLDDSVMHQRDLAIFVGVRMGVDFVWHAVGGNPVLRVDLFHLLVVGIRGAGRD